MRLRLSVEGDLASLGLLSQVSGWDYPVIGVGWTLEYEMLFHLLFALAIPIRDPRLATAAETGALLVGALVFGVGAIALEFPAGMALALLWRARGTGPRRGAGARRSDPDPDLGRRLAELAAGGCSSAPQALS